MFRSTPPSFDRQLSLSPMSQHRAAQMTSFADLSEEARETVVRHLSDHPDSPTWRLYVDSDLALSCVRSAHPLADTAQLLLEKLGSVGDQDGVPVLGLGAVLAWIKAAGHALTSIELPEISLAVDAPLRRDISPALERHCVSLRSLSIVNVDLDEMASKILQATSGRLCVLEARGCHAGAVELHCAGLEAIALFGRIESTAFLKCVGPTLRCLDLMRAYIAYPASDRGLLRGMKSFCRTLSDISIKVCSESVEEFAQLLILWGARVQVLDTLTLPVNVLCRVVRLCPQLKITNFMELEPDVTAALGPSIRNLLVNVHNEKEMNTLASEIAKCSDVSSIDVSAGEAHAAATIAKIYASPKPLLNSLGLFMMEGEYMDSGLRELARQKNGLRSIELRGLIRDMNVMKTISSGLQLLESITIFILDPLHPLGGSLAGLVRCFDGYPALRLLKIDVWGEGGYPGVLEEVANAARRLRLSAAVRGRRLQILVEGEDYTN